MPIGPSREERHDDLERLRHAAGLGVPLVDQRRRAESTLRSAGRRWRHRPAARSPAGAFQHLDRLAHRGAIDLESRASSRSAGSFCPARSRPSKCVAQLLATDRDSLPRRRSERTTVRLALFPADYGWSNHCKTERRAVSGDRVGVPCDPNPDDTIARMRGDEQQLGAVCYTLGSAERIVTVAGRRGQHPVSPPARSSS